MSGMISMVHKQKKKQLEMLQCELELPATIIIWRDQKETSSFTITTNAMINDAHQQH